MGVNAMVPKRAKSGSNSRSCDDDDQIKTDVMGGNLKHKCVIMKCVQIFVVSSISCSLACNAISYNIYQL
jgi:hypothetical protein